MLEWSYVVITLIIAIATVVYATLTYFLLREQRREKKKPVIEEMLKVVIHPLLKDVQGEIQFLRQEKFGLYHDLKRMVCHELEPRKLGAKGIVYENFAIRYPGIPVLLNHHDVEFYHLKESLENLANKLLSVGFKEKCVELITKYNESAKRAHLSDSDVNYLLMFVIEKTREVEEGHVAREFWDINGAELLSFRERADVKEYIKNLENKRRELLRTCGELEAELKRLINQFRDNYGIEIVGA